MNKGGLLELVARGKKDIFFTANPTISFFHSVYIKSSPFTKEIYVSKPRNSPEWGRWVDFDFEHRGDIANNTYLRIELPSWLPPNVQEINKSGIVTYDEQGTTYGYCNNVGFQMIEKIQFFQDQVKVHETFGEYLDWRLRQSHTFSTTYIVGAQVGTYQESPLALGRTASGMVLRVPFSILGWQNLQDPGLPMCALKNERFRIRVHLRKLEEIVVASDGRLHPNPWSKPLFVQSHKNGKIDKAQVSKSRESMKNIGVSLETTQVYIPADVQLVLKSQTLRIPFNTIQFQQYTLEDNLLTASSLNPQNIYKFPLAIDCIGSVNRMLLGFRSEASTEAGQRTNLQSSVIHTLRLNIANIDRVKQWEKTVFREVTSYWKNNRMGIDLSDATKPHEIYTITLGGYDNRYPSGTINFTRAVDSILFTTLGSIDYDPRNVSRKMFALFYVEAWNIYEIANGNGKCMFDDS